MPNDTARIVHTLHRKPPVYEAVYWDGTLERAQFLLDWCPDLSGGFGRMGISLHHRGGGHIPAGFWIVHGPDGLNVHRTLDGFEDVSDATAARGAS